MFAGVIDGNPAVSEMGLGSLDLQLLIYLYKKLKIVSTIEKLLIKWNCFLIEYSWQIYLLERW